MTDVLQLAPREIAVLRAIQKYWDANGYAPSMRQLNDELNFHSTSAVRYYVLKLETHRLLHIPRDQYGTMLAHTIKLTALGFATYIQSKPQPEGTHS